MIAGIYVGKPMAVLDPNFPVDDEYLNYGRRGQVTEAVFPSINRVLFWPEGQQMPWSVYRREVYIPSKHQTRHCPKP